MTEQDPLRILMVGADASLWIGLSSIFGVRSSQIVVPKEIDEANLIQASNGVDVVVVVLHSDNVEALHIVAGVGLQKRTVVLADPGDHRLAAEAVLYGVAGYVEKGATPEHLARAITQVAARGMHFDGPAAAEMHSRFERVHPGSSMSHLAAAKALASALELKDTYTGGHAERVTQMAMKLAQIAMWEEALPSQTLEAAFLLHDIGKIGVPESILNKPGKLTDTERRVLQTHPILGERVVSPLGFPPAVGQVIRHHHERWDGSGYPDGLAAEAIPAPARLFSIADVMDAMTSIRPYRKPVSFEQAVEEIMRCAGTQFDPMLCALAEEAFLESPIELFGTSVL
jgi:HD-GYP domain-containing protein (c-di-GMP phosphodiesterase class II)